MGRNLNLRWLAVAIFVLAAWVLLQWPDGNLHLVFCDVGQGDASLVIRGDFQMVIDGGPKGEALLACLGKHLPFWDRTVELVVNTHPQKDHLGGLDDLLRAYRVEKLLINGVFGGGKDGEELRELVTEKGIELMLPKKGDIFRVGDLQFDVLWPEERMGDKLAWNAKQVQPEDLQVEPAILGRNTDVNVVSVVGRLRLGEFEAMFSGDIGEVQEEKLVENGSLRQVEVLKVAHHGSKYSSGEGFLAEIKPRVAVISVGENKFGHPTKETLERLRNVGARIFRTDLDGEVEIVTDGERYWMP